MSRHKGGNISYSLVGMIGHDSTWRKAIKRNVSIFVYQWPIGRVLMG